MNKKYIFYFVCLKLAYIKNKNKTNYKDKF